MHNNFNAICLSQQGEKKRIEGPTKQNCILGLVIFFQKFTSNILVKIRCKFNAHLIGAITALSKIVIWDEGDQKHQH